MDQQTGETVATSRRGSLMSKSGSLGIDIQPNAMHLLEMIVLSFVIVEQKRREQAARATKVSVHLATGV